MQDCGPYSVTCVFRVGREWQRRAGYDGRRLGTASDCRGRLGVVRGGEGQRGTVEDGGGPQRMARVMSHDEIIIWLEVYDFNLG